MIIPSFKHEVLVRQAMQYQTVKHPAISEGIYASSSRLFITKDIKMSLKTVKVMAPLSLCVLVVSFYSNAPAWGFGSWSQATDATGYTHILNNPNDYPSWDLTNITYKFDSDFTSNTQIRNQVRLAFDQWDNANGTVQGANYSYNRAGGARPFVDIRSVAVHEIGHTLGFRHPNQATAVNRNWRPAGATYAQQADNNNEVMRSWINEGDYNHVLSHDELDGFDYFYGRDLNFTEVTGSTTANITIGTYTNAANIWATGGWSGNWRNAADLSQGIQITSGTIDFNTDASSPLGLQTLAINWDYQNTSGKDTAGIEIRTTGTNNPTPLWHFDGYSPASSNNFFNSFTTTSIGANAKDDLMHTWDDPAVSGTPGPFAASDVIHVGLKQDVWDWSVVSAQVVHPDNTRTNAPLLGIHGPWEDTIAGVSAASGSGGDGMTAGPRYDIGARGIRLVNGDTLSTLTELALVDVTGMNLDLFDLNGAVMESLGGRRIDVDFEGPINLKEREDLFLVLNGIQPTHSGAAIFLNGYEKLLDGELMVFAQTKTASAIVGTYGLVGQRTIVPEPASLLLLTVCGTWAGCRRRYRLS
jgi:hypothetical protein